MIRLSLFLLLIIIWLPNYAQVIEPLESNSLLEHYNKENIRLKTTAVKTDTLKLPFWDDFSVKATTDSLWIPGGGVYINNYYCFNQPTYNVATFDGLKSNGRPYVPGIITAVGAADSLTSKPINLSQYHSGDLLYLRFFYQPGGLGDAPDQTTDSIRLQFKNVNNDWITVWNKNNIPTEDDSTFQFKVITISDVKYFFNGFQFRFQSFGKLSGNFDVWNLDYIMLDEGALASQSSAPDISYRKASPSILKNYTSMPLRQFEANKDPELADEIEFEAVSLRSFRRGYKIISKPDSSFIKNTENSQVYQTLVMPSVTDFTGFLDSKIQKHTVNKSAIPDNEHLPLNIQYQSTIINGDPDINEVFDLNKDTTGLVSRLDFNVNNTLGNYTPISNYYSYDDGSAEMGFGVNEQLGKVAVKYHLNVPDTITSVKINFPSLNEELENSPLVIFVWKGIQNNVQGAQIIGDPESVLLKHSDVINGFFEYKFKKPVVLNFSNADFFVGYQQSNASKLLVGLDKNIDTRQNIYFNVGSIWQQLTKYGGSLLIHPVFGSKNVITNIPEKQHILEADVYPNPATDRIYINGKIKTATLYDLSGRILLNTTFEDATQYSSHELEISSIPNGFYLLQLENEEAKTVKKIIIAK